MTEQWQELKETITELRDNDGTGTQQEVCKFLVNYMEVLEKQMQQSKTGHWITKPHVYGVTYCSECDFELKIDDTNFCPNCGAKMVESQKRSE